jgi:hypothetical protein
MMPWYAIVLIVWEAVTALLYVANIGRSVDLTEGGAIVTLILTGLTIWAIAALSAA